MNTPKQTFHARNDSVLHSSPACDRIKSKQRPFKCPACDKKTILFYLPTTEVRDLPVECKRCGVTSLVNISPEPEPRTV